MEELFKTHNIKIPLEYKTFIKSNKIRITNILQFFSKYNVIHNLTIFDLFRIVNNLKEFTKKYKATQNKEKFKIIFDKFYNDDIYKTYCYNKTKNWQPPYEKMANKALKYFKTKFGDTELAVEEYKKSCIKCGKSLRVEYYIDQGLTEAEAKKALKNRQSTFSKQKCIKKYGEKLGIEKWENRQILWQKTLNSKDPEELKRIRLAKMNNFKIGGNNKSVSKAELELCTLLNCQSQFMLTNNDKIYIYDIRKDNKIIEYNGDFWHSNPKLYDSNYFNKVTGFLAKDKWEYDNNKVNFAKSLGYDILVIWENDWNKNKQEVIKLCMEFINGN